MKKLVLLLFLKCLALANVYEILSDFAYEKSQNKELKITDAKLLSLKQNQKPCLEILLTQNEVFILKAYQICKNLENDKAFKAFLNNDFLSLYKNKPDLSELNSIKNAMRELMIYYKLHFSFAKNLSDMSKNKNLRILNLNENGGILLYKINEQDCVTFELSKHNNKMSMIIYGLENLDKKCKILVNSPSFKELSYTKNGFVRYYLE